MEIITTTTAAATIVIKLKEIFSKFTDKKRKAKGMKYKILDEIQSNVRILRNHYIEKGFPVEKVIQALEVASLNSAFVNGYNFNEITKKKISGKYIEQSRFLERYIEMSLEEYFKTIKNNIVDLKLSLTNYDDYVKRGKVRFGVRLKNLVKKYQLLHNLLNDK